MKRLMKTALLLASMAAISSLSGNTGGERVRK